MARNLEQLNIADTPDPKEEAALNVVRGEDTELEERTEMWEDKEARRLSSNLSDVAVFHLYGEYFDDDPASIGEARIKVVSELVQKRLIMQEEQKKQHF